MTVELIVNTKTIAVNPDSQVVEINPNSTTLELQTTVKTIELTNSIIPVKGDPYTSVEYPITTPSNEWTIAHGKGYYPNVIILNEDGVEYHGGKVYPDKNTVVISFGEPFTGIAVIN